MNMRCEYIIEMKWMNEGDSKDKKNESFDIDTAHITNMTMINDYEGTNMPILYTDLTLDKNYMDKIIKNAKTAYIYLYIYKVFTKQDTGLELKQLTKYNGKMSYFIDQDINYNKELDYADDPEKQEVLQTFSIGMMFSECIETNKQIANTTLINTTRMNAVAYYLQQYPFLIDTFTYNDPIDQLVLPPMESLSKTIDYLNNIKVFYDTPYRFYIEPGCVYLLNSSGEGTPKEGDKYDTVLFDVISTDNGPLIEDGIQDNDESGCYYIGIHVKDTYYTIDTDTKKKYNTISSIIDPGIKNTVPFLDAVNDAMKEINNAKSKLNGIVKNAVSSVKSIPSSLTDYKSELLTHVNDISYLIDHPTGIDFVDETMRNIASSENPYQISTATTLPSNIDQSIKMIQTMKSLYIESGNSESGITRKKLISDSKCDEWIKKLSGYKAEISSNKKVVDMIPGLYEKTTGKLLGILNESTSVTSLVNSISPINLSDNLSSMINKVTGLKSNIAEHTEAVDNSLLPKINNALKIAHYAKASSSVISEAGRAYQEYLDSLQSGEDGGSSKKQDNPFDAWKRSTAIASNSIDKSANQISKTLTEYKSANTKASSLVANIEPQIKAMSNFKTDIKSTITGTWDNLVNIGKTAKKSLDKIIQSARDIEQNVKSLDFSINSLQDLQKDINMVKDISKIGMLGLSSFDADLKLSDDESDDFSGTKIIRIKNDNANVIKNIKAHIENHANMLSVTKTDMDTSVLSLNKKYLVNNYDAHSAKNGVFLLTRKTDYFLRAGDKFTISTKLDMAKIAEPGDQKISRKDDIESIINNSKKIINVYKANRGNKFSIRSLGEIVNSAQSIQDSYNRLRNDKKK